MGTRFIATPEAQAVPGYKDALLALGEDGTVITRGYTGKTCRVVRNDYTQYWESHTDELQPFPAQFIRSMNDGANHLGADEHDHRHRPRPGVLAGRPGRRRHRTSWSRPATWSARSWPRPKPRHCDRVATDRRTLTQRRAGSAPSYSDQALSFSMMARGSSPTGVTLSMVTPASLKAAMRSLT